MTKEACQKLGERDIEAMLQRLDRLAHDGALITAVPTLEVGGCLQSCSEYEGGNNWQQGISASASVDCVRDGLSMFYGPQSSDIMSDRA
jgi:hypothetical protein